MLHPVSSFHYLQSPNHCLRLSHVVGWGAPAIIPASPHVTIPLWVLQHKSARPESPPASTIKMQYPGTLNIYRTGARRWVLQVYVLVHPPRCV